MCVSSYAIEHQAYSFAEQIIKHSIYKPVCVDLTGEKSIFIENHSLLLDNKNSSPNEPIPFICQVTLEDQDGQLYKIKPSENGLRFARGEITYKEYTRIEKKESWQLISLFLVSIGVFFTLSWGLLYFLL